MEQISNSINGRLPYGDNPTHYLTSIFLVESSPQKLRCLCLGVMSTESGVRGENSAGITITSNTMCEASKTDLLYPISLPTSWAIPKSTINMYQDKRNVDIFVMLKVNQITKFSYLIMQLIMFVRCSCHDSDRSYGGACVPT